MQEAIGSAYPGATVVSRAGIDATACAPVPESPGFVTADFDGDGRADFAVLLKIGETGKVVDWNGKTLHETRYVLAIFVAVPEARFKMTHAIPFTDFAPVAIVIDLIPPGTITSPGDPGNRPTRVLRHAAVELVNCEKSSVVYYLSAGRVREFWTSD